MMLTWALILITVVVGSCGDVLCAKGMAGGGEVPSFGRGAVGYVFRSIFTRRLLILGIACDAIAFFSLLALLSVSQLSIAVPATALSFVIDTLGAGLLLREQVHWRRWLGVLFVTAGVLLTVHSGGDGNLGNPGAPAPAAVQAHQH